MQINFFGLFSVDALYIVLGLAGFSLLVFILAIIALAKTSKLKKKYKLFMEGTDGKSIEKMIKENLDNIADLEDLTQKHSDSIQDVYEKLHNSFQKIGIVKYDAYHEMGGQLSFALCLLDRNNNGCLLNVMHSNTGCYAYVKEIVNGKSFIELGGEEEKALQQAIAGKMGDADLSEKINDMVQKDKL